jgi:hypothetical protein
VLCYWCFFAIVKFSSGSGGFTAAVDFGCGSGRSLTVVDFVLLVVKLLQWWILVLIVVE